MIPLQAAPVVGILAGLVVHFATWALEKLELDDAVGAIPVHGACGILGIVATPLFCGSAALSTHLSTYHLASRLDWFGVQCVGAAACIGLSVAGGFLTWLVIGRFTSLRVTADAERVGMNFSEHRLEESGGAA